MFSWKWKTESIRFDPAGSSPILASRSRFSRGALQHGVRKIRAYDSRTTLPCLTAKRESHVAGTAAYIENAIIRPRQYPLELSRGAAPPHAVDVERQNVIQKVVARSNRGKHVAYRASSRLRVARSLRRSSGYSRFGSFRHEDSLRLPA